MCMQNEGGGREVLIRHLGKMVWFTRLQSVVYSISTNEGCVLRRSSYIAVTDCDVHVS